MLFKAPEQRTSKTGKPFATATIRGKDGEATQWVRVTAFSESARAELMRLAEGDAVSVQDPFKAELYAPAEGEPKISLSIVADNVRALRQPPASKLTDSRSRQESPAGSWAAGEGPNDPPPF